VHSGGGGGGGTAGVMSVKEKRQAEHSQELKALSQSLAHRVRTPLNTTAVLPQPKSSTMAVASGAIGRQYDIEACRKVL
jgi:hypothetical protein